MTETKEHKEYLSIGIDFGGVLSVHDTETDKKSGHRSTKIDMPFVHEALKYLKSQGHKLYLVSFCGKLRAKETAEVIAKEIPNVFDELYFVKDKKHKKSILSSLGCHVMIDDTWDVIQDIFKFNDKIRLIYFTGDPTHPGPKFDPESLFNRIFELTSWKDIQEFIQDITYYKTEQTEIKKSLIYEN